VNESKESLKLLTIEGKEKVSVGIDIANKCGSALEDIVEQASGIGSLISQISISFKEQSAGISEISNSMGLLDKTCHQNAAISKDNFNFSNKLQDQTQNLDNVIDLLGSMMTKKQ
jgi:methyl-accepting chemotaxis protein